MIQWLRKCWSRFKLWLDPPAPAINLPKPIALVAPPRGFDSWFAWEAVQFTQVPAAFWLDPFRYGVRPTEQEEREAQDRVAALFGLRVGRPYSGPAYDPYRSLLNGAPIW